MKIQSFFLYLDINLLLILLSFPSPSAAQIVPDATLSKHSEVVNEGNTSNITGGTQAGNNLFHSFDQFSIPTGGTAYFNNLPEIQNIFSRVTGSSISNIDGILKANGTANLFLLNPNGIIFGSNAKLDIGGSFLGTTASSIKFANGIEFSTKKSQATSLLKVSVPIGLGFGSNPEPITVQRASLNILKEKTFALVGGDLELQGSNLKAEEGRVELGSVGETGIVQLNTISKGFALDYRNLSNFRNIKLSQDALVNVNGEGSGDVQIQGRRVTLTDNSRVEAKTLGTKAGGYLTVNASDSVELIRGFSPNFRKLPGLFSATLGSGKAGKITINTQQLLLQDGAVVSSSTLGQGQGGDLIVNASKTVSIIGIQQPPGQSSALLSVASGSNNAGNVVINTRQLIVKNGGVVSASTGSSGNGGNLIVNALDSVEVKGTSASGRTLSSLRAEARAEFNPANNFLLSTPTGSAGDLKVVTNSFSVRDGALVSVANEGPRNAGQLEIQADRIDLNKGVIRASSNSGEGGDIFLRSHSLQLRNSSNITATAGGSGNGGNISINTDTLAALPKENSDISANAFMGSGGNIQITTQGLFGIAPKTLRTSLSDITASSDLGIEGVIDVKTIGFDVRNAIIPLQANFIPPEQALAASCLARRNAEQSSFVVSGTGGLPTNPYSGVEVWDALTGGVLGQAQTIPVSQKLPNLDRQNRSNKKAILASLEQPNSNQETLVVLRPSKWKVGDPIVEAQGIITTPDGRSLLESIQQQRRIQSPESLVCGGG